jgi:hypothetical protein
VTLGKGAAKAWVAAAVAGLAVAQDAADHGFTLGECLGMAGAALVAFQAVYWTSNGPKDDGDT